MSDALPSLFLAHGAPDLPLSDHPAKRFLGELAARLPRPKAILVISAHWEADAPALTAAPAPETIYDFRGFPEALRRMRYPARTDPALIDRVAALLEAAGLRATRDPERGYDHGAWVPLLLSYPEAAIPVVQLSLLRGDGGEAHFRLGEALAPLREEGVLVIGSGAAVHNLREIAPEGAPTPDWAAAYDAWVAERVAARDRNALGAFPDPASRRAHPTPEHLLPLQVAFGAGWDGGAQKRIHRSFSYASISMSAYAFGAPADLAAL